MHAQQDARRRHDRDVTLAWHIGALVRMRNAKKFPELKTLLVEKPTPRPQTAQHHMTMLTMLGLKGHPTTGVDARG